MPDALTAKLAASIMVAKDDMDVTKPMYRYGVDSLVAVELRNRFAKKLTADIAIFDILGESTFLAVGTLAARRSS